MNDGMRVKMLSSVFGLAGVVTAYASQVLPSMPLARAPFERGDLARRPVKMEVKSFSYGTNIWQGVEFVSGVRRLVISGVNGTIDRNNPLRFGRLFFFNDITLEGELWLKCGDLWDHMWSPRDVLTVEPEKNRAIWSRPYQLANGKQAVFSYVVTGREDGTVAIAYDMGVSQGEACAQDGGLPISSCFSISPAVGAQSEFGFGDAVHKMYPREKLIAENRKQCSFPVENPERTSIFNFEKGNPARAWSVVFPQSWVKRMQIFDFVGEVCNGKERRGVTLHYPIADFGRTNPHGLQTRGEIILDFGQSTGVRQRPLPCVGGIDFWGEDAVHVPVFPSRNLLQNGSFEQDFKGWRWDDWGAKYTQTEKLREEIVADAKVGRHALLLRGTQPKCPPLCSAPMALVNGRKYTVSCWAKSLTGKRVNFSFRVRSVSNCGKYWQFRGLKDFPAQFAEKDWVRKSFTFEADAGGFWVQLGAPGGAENGVLIDGIQVEEGERVTDFDEVPYVANLVSNDPFNDFKPGDEYGVKLDVQAFGKAAKGKVRVRIYNFYHEAKFDRTYPLVGDAMLPLDVDPMRLGMGVFVVRLDYDISAHDSQHATLNWSDYARFSVLKPHDGSHPTAQFYANHPWYERVSRCMDYMRKFVAWGWNSTDGGLNHTGPIKDAEGRLGIRNYVHPVVYERAKMAEVADRMLTSEQATEFKGDMRKWKGADPEKLKAIEQLAYELAKECDPKDDIWTFWNEEETWARQVGFDTHVKFIMAVRRGVQKAFAERRLPPPRFSETHGTSHYFSGRNYDAIEGYLKAADDNGFKYDVVTIHPYQNIDGGTLGPKDADLETQHLIDQMKEHCYPDSTPIMFTECFNMLPYRVPQWGADGWGDSYRCNTQCSQDRGNREFVMAASQARLYILALKYWPKVQLVHPWNCNPIMDIRFTPLSFILSVNTVAHLLPSPKYFGDAQPYADVRGYCFEQGERAVMAMWTTDHDVERGVKRSPYVQMTLPRDARCYDLEGNERRVEFSADGSVRVPLTPAPLFFVASDAKNLLTALQESVAEDPSVALALDVRPTIDGKVNLIVQNKTKAVQRGKLGIDGKEFAYELAPLARRERTLKIGTAEPMKLQHWNGRFSILQKPWDIKYFFVPKCGKMPNWNCIPKLPLSSVCADRKWVDGGFKATCQASWNEDYFFVRLEVEDPSYVSYRDSGLAFAPGDLYQYDGALEVYFDGFGDARTQGEKDYDLNDSRYDFCEEHVHRLRAVNWQLAQGTASATDQEIKDKLVRRFTRTKKGYVYEIAFAARYMAPIDLKPGTIAGFGVALHDWNCSKDKAGKRTHATFSTSTRPGADLNMKPYLMPLIVLGE